MDHDQIRVIERFVTTQRRALTADVERQISAYGIQPTGEILPESSLGHLTDAERLTADQLRQRMLHLSAAHGGKSAAVTLMREQAFTSLNRLIALRMAEERGLIPEAIGSGLESEGFEVFLQTSPPGAMDRYAWYREYLFLLFDELSVELPSLFDRFRGEGLVFPRQDTLLALIAAMNDPAMRDSWALDETIGWVYQYFNDPRERKKMREKTAPTDSYELAVRNQFFTPRYVVRFLVDNSLGRLWCEMVRDRDALDGVCAMTALTRSDELTRVAAKDPREITVIDPACGSMHFGLYTFDVLAAVYESAWKRANEVEAFAPLRDAYPDMDTLQREIPRLVCERNIFGVDIDGRAVQIAGITLWLRAHRWWHEHGLRAADRPRISRFNLATAQPMPGEKEYYTEFLASLGDAALRKITESVWNEMKIAGELGSLLRIERGIEREVAALRAASERYRTAEAGQSWFVAEEQSDHVARRYGVDLSTVKAEDDWAEMHERVYAALEQYALSYRNKSGGYQRSLFADDTHAGFACIDILRRRYDVVLMNPPFGASATRAKGYIAKEYPRTKNDLYAAFVESFLDRLAPGGYLGAITSRTGFFLSTYTKWREEILLQEAEPIVMADLGFGVLDAMVETAAYVLRSR